MPLIKYLEEGQVSIRGTGLLASSFCKGELSGRYRTERCCYAYSVCLSGQLREGLVVRLLYA